MDVILSQNLKTLIKKVGNIFTLGALIIFSAFFNPVEVKAENNNIIVWGPQITTTQVNGSYSGYYRYGAEIVTTGTYAGGDNYVALRLYITEVGTDDVLTSNNTYSKSLAELYRVTNDNRTLPITIKAKGHDAKSINATLPGSYLYYVAIENGELQGTTQISSYYVVNIGDYYIDDLIITNIGPLTGATPTKTKLYSWTINGGNGGSSSGGSSVWTQEQITALLNSIENIESKLDEISEKLDGAEITTGQQETITQAEEKNETMKETSGQMIEQEEQLLTDAESKIEEIDADVENKIGDKLKNSFKWVRDRHDETIGRTEINTYIQIIMILGFATYIIGRRAG